MEDSFDDDVPNDNLNVSIPDLDNENCITRSKVFSPISQLDGNDSLDELDIATTSKSRYV